MREFLTMANLLKAMALAAVLTVMSTGRILQVGILPGVMIAACFVLMTFVCGAVTAWGTSSGMPGIVTERRTLLHGCATAVALSAIALPIQVVWTDPALHAALLASSRPAVTEIAFPSTLNGRIALVLWATGFQAMFLQAAPMSFATRLLKRRDLALGFCLVFRAYVSYRQVVDHEMSSAVPLFLIANVLAAAAGCALFARYGLVPCMLFSAGVSLHVFISPGSTQCD